MPKRYQGDGAAQEGGEVSRRAEGESDGSDGESDDEFGVCRRGAVSLDSSPSVGE